jgi:hypothetical protein
MLITWKGGFFNGLDLTSKFPSECTSSKRFSPSEVQKPLKTASERMMRLGQG